MRKVVIWEVQVFAILKKDHKSGVKKEVVIIVIRVLHLQGSPQLKNIDSGGGKGSPGPEGDHLPVKIGGLGSPGP